MPRTAPQLTPLLLLVLLLIPSSGCSVVSGSRLDDCRTRVQALQAEAQQLRDITVSLRQQNKDMAQRALDNARLLEAERDAVQRLEQSVAEYQGQRDALAAQLDAIKSQVRTAALASPTTALLDRLDQFSADHPDCRFDRTLSAVAIPADLLFASGSNELAPSAIPLLNDLAQTLQPESEGGLSLRILGPPSRGSNSPVIHASNHSADPPPPSDASLGLARARAVRDRLTAQSGIDPSLCAVSSGSAPSSSTGEIQQASASPPAPSWVAIQVRRLTDPANP